jgi:hypothetical protein
VNSLLPSVVARCRRTTTAFGGASPCIVVSAKVGSPPHTAAVRSFLFERRALHQSGFSGQPAD